MASQLFKFDFSKRQQPTSAPNSAADSIHRASPTASALRTMTPADKMEMSQEVFNRYRNLIYKLCGIYFADSKKYLLEGRIVRRLVAHKMNTFEEYLTFLESPAGRTELNELFEAITINETYFFRAPQQFDALEKTVIPELIARKKNELVPTVRIWVAASSSGEEAYTIAIIIVDRLKIKYPNVRFEIYASDIDRVVLEQAKKAVYKNYAIRTVPKDILAKYFKFDAASQTYALSEQIKRMVRFSSVNLYDAGQMRQMNHIDVIFCCNVLIYFDMASKQQVVSYMYDSLNKGGYLFVGYSESLHGVTKAFKLVHLSQAMAYQKE
jgi:chemotaxis protein methyltransferase CheR